MPQFKDTMALLNLQSLLCRSVQVCVAATLASSFAYATETAQIVQLRVDTSTVVSRIPPDFIGFGYETSAVAQSNYFSATNAVLVRLYRQLSPHGLIRIGGNVSDHTRFEPEGVAAARTEREITVINNASLQNLGDFARATGWKVMWGLNLGSGSKEEAAREAVAVDAALGTNLHSFQIGNEVDALRRFEKKYELYHAAYTEYKAAIRAALPKAVFSGPDVIGNWEWITNFVKGESQDMRLLTHHYYRGGARNPSSTMEKLLRRDTAWEERLRDLQQLCREHHLAYRICEVNSFYGGGRPGVSDTFGSALWCLDYMFCLASFGCEGVNMETDVNQLGFISHYSPIVHDENGRCSVRPEYYGMLAFAFAAKGDLVGLTFENTNTNLSVYATKAGDGTLFVTALNKDFAHSMAIEVRAPKDYGRGEVLRLAAPSVESKTGVTFGTSAVTADGTWTPGAQEKCELKQGIVRLNLPRASAVVLSMRPR
ncbi:MAG: hypothetical protein C5B50_22055 [Verrucomicrobia bacterium]|nr:MAG: hypothetical protein C5B50_22055 [Verrucomicrobiota bacterium]